MNEPTAFFQVGGTLSEDAPSYIERPADNKLLAALERGELCLVLAPRQTGKSSLMVHAVARLRKKGVSAGIVDLQPLGTQRDPERWFSDAVYQIERTLKLKIDTKEWWKANNRLGPTQRFMTFLEDVMLTEVRGNVVLFFDEIDSVFRLPFSDDFFTTIRSVYNARAHNSVLRRLTFVLLGVATASSFIQDRSRTPFNIGRSIALDDFDQKATGPFRRVLGPNSDRLIGRIFYWTNGHPLLVQRLAAAVFSWMPNERSIKRIDEEVKRTYFEGRIENDTHLNFIQGYLLADSAGVRKTLRTYQNVLMEKDVSENDQDPIQSRLKLSGVVKAKDGYLQVRNEIYRRVFDLDWAKKNTPTNWTRIVTYIAVIVAVLAVGAILYNAWVGIRFQDCYASFYQTNAPEERVAHLAKMFRLRGLLGPTDYDYRTRELFYGLSREEQLALFGADNVEDSDLIVVIKELHITLADVDGTDSTRPLLEAMVQALGDLNATEETEILESELNSWLEGRELAEQNQYADALAKYNNAIVLNGENPATLYERARVLVELSEYQQALNDLDQVMAIARRAPAPTPTVPPTTTPAASSPPTIEPTTPPTLTPTSTSTPGTDITPTETSAAGVTPTSASLPISTETPTPTNTLLPTYTPTPAAITSEFVTIGQMISAVRDIISRNLDLLSYLASASSSEYPNLREFGLVSTPTLTPTPSVVESKIVALETYHGKYVTAMDADRDWVLRAETTELKDWEKFTLFCLDNGKVALETYHGKYVTAMNDQPGWDWELRAETTELKDWEKFTLVETETAEELLCSEVFRLLEQGDVGIALRTYHDRYVTAMNDEGNRDWVLRAETKVLSDWEKFTVILYIPTAILISPTNTSTPESPTSTLTPAPINATVKAEALNLRAGPGTEYAIVGKLAQGDVATVIGQNPGGDWLKVEHEGETGWVSKEYVEAPPEVAMVPIVEVPPPPTSTPSPEPTAIPTPTQMPPPTQLTPTPVPPTVTPVLSPTPTVTPTPTPTSFIVIDDMEQDSIPHWQPSTDSVSVIIISSVPGRTGNAIEVSYNLKKDGWVLISKELNPGALSGTEKIRFYYRGSGASNTIELKLVYKDIGGTTFGILWNRATVRDNWVSVEVPYSLFDCWWPEDNCLRYGGELDINKGLRIDFAISNKSGDEPGSGDVMIDDVQAIR